MPLIRSPAPPTPPPLSAILAGKPSPGPAAGRPPSSRSEDAINVTGLRRPQPGKRCPCTFRVHGPRRRTTPSPQANRDGLQPRSTSVHPPLIDYRRSISGVECYGTKWETPIGHRGPRHQKAFFILKANYPLRALADPGRHLQILSPRHQHLRRGDHRSRRPSRLVSALTRRPRGDPGNSCCSGRNAAGCLGSSAPPRYPSTAGTRNTRSLHSVWIAGKMRRLPPPCGKSGETSSSASPCSPAWIWPASPLPIPR